jgi:hypothetical protein
VTLTTKLVVSAVAGAAALLLTHYWRQFPLRLALISGIAIGVLTYSTLQASMRLRNVYRRR